MVLLDTRYCITLNLCVQMPQSLFCDTTCCPAQVHYHYYQPCVSVVGASVWFACAHWVPFINRPVIVCRGVMNPHDRPTAVDHLEIIARAVSQCSEFACTQTQFGGASFVTLTHAASFMVQVVPMCTPNGITSIMLVLR